MPFFCFLPASVGSFFRYGVIPIWQRLPPCRLLSRRRISSARLTSSGRSAQSASRCSSVVRSTTARRRSEKSHELPAAAHRPRDRAAQLQPDRGGERAVHLAIGRQQAHPRPGGRTRRRAVRAARQAAARPHRPRQGDGGDRRAHAGRHGQHQAARRAVLQSRAGPDRHRHHAHAGALRAAARGGRVPQGLPQGAPDAAPGQPDRDRHHGQRRRRRHRHLHRDAAGGADADHLPLLQLAPRRDRAQGSRAGNRQAADAGGDRRMADHHLPRGLHRPRHASTRPSPPPGWPRTWSCRPWIPTC